MKVEDQLVCETETMPWVVVAPGVEEKQLALFDAQESHTTAIIRLAPLASLPPPQAGSGREVVVLGGQWISEGGPLEAGDYSRRPASAVAATSTETGCTLFVKIGPFGEDDNEVVHMRVSQQPWLPGQGNLTVKPLHSFGTTGTALVHWPAGERFLPHKHWGGEEILVLSGTFRDEHGSYPCGSWIRSPHLSTHHPFVEEETVIFVKTGHLTGA